MKKTYTTTYYNSINDLDNHWRSNRTIKLQELQRNMVREGFGTMANIINNKYGYRLMKENTKFEMIGKKKHPKYQEYEEALETIKSAFTSMSADKGLSDITTKIKPSLDFYNAEGIACKTKTKDDIKLKHINLYNQALAYYWVEDFEQATQYAKEILKFSNKDKDAKKLLENIEYAKALLNMPISLHGMERWWEEKPNQFTKYDLRSTIFCLDGCWRKLQQRRTCRCKEFSPAANWRSLSERKNML
jgi:tetratricopeptide (TPR) repeat protein